jgi:hypothetical protein
MRETLSMPVLSLPWIYLAWLDELVHEVLLRIFRWALHHLSCLSTSESCWSRPFMRGALIAASAVTVGCPMITNVPQVSWSLCHMCTASSRMFVAHARRTGLYWFGHSPQSPAKSVCNPLDSLPSSSLSLSLCYGYTSGSSQSHKCSVPSPYYWEGQRGKDIYSTESL